jgi:aminoglycoside 6-adenylyltransferase
MMMQVMPQEKDVLEKLVAWGNAHTSIRAMILTSSRARPDGQVDILSDYDIIFAVTDADQFGREDGEYGEYGWLADFGKPMVRFSDQGEVYNLTTYWRGVIYEDYVKIDYSVWPVALLERIAAEGALLEQLDVGYRVLLDKDGRTSGWKLPSYKAHIPVRPTEAEYQALVEEFWWETTYVAKSLWRDELVFAKWCLEHEIKLEVMRRLLEWRVEIDHDWSLKPGVYGRGLERQLPADIWSDFASTYVGSDSEDNWGALFRLMALFRRVAMEVGGALGYAYPQPLDDRVGAYLETVRKLPRGVEPGHAEDAKL